MRKIKKLVITLLFPLICFSSQSNKNENSGQVTIFPAPKGEAISHLYKISVLGKEVPVYNVKVAPEDEQRRWKAMDDKINSADYYDTAAFAYFDMEGSATVKVSVSQSITQARILPLSANIKPIIQGNSLTFNVDSPRNLTIEINGEWIRSLHLFINAPETYVPGVEDTNVIYFSPGIHEISNLVIGDNKTVYIAGGAVVRAVIKPGEKYGISSYSGLKTYSPSIDLRGQNITVCGRGIIDASGCTTHSRNMISVSGSDIRLEGIILRDSPTWTIPIRDSDHVTVKNVKLLGYRANSDGIDITGSSNVTVDDCFVRTLDDLIVVKTTLGNTRGSSHIMVKNCVLWNQVAHALSIGAEITKDIENVLFTDCDIIHDQGREWSLRIYHTDAATVDNVRFENIRIEESIKCISLWINPAIWSSDQERGHIKGVTFRNIQAKGSPLTLELKGFDESHIVENVLFKDVTLNGEALTDEMIKKNKFIKNINIQP